MFKSFVVCPLLDFRPHPWVKGATSEQPHGGEGPPQKPLPCCLPLLMFTSLTAWDPDPGRRDLPLRPCLPGPTLTHRPPAGYFLWIHSIPAVRPTKSRNQDTNGTPLSLPTHLFSLLEFSHSPDSQRKLRLVLQGLPPGSPLSEPIMTAAGFLVLSPSFIFLFYFKTILHCSLLPLSTICILFEKRCH